MGQVRNAESTIKYQVWLSKFEFELTQKLRMKPHVQYRNNNPALILHVSAFQDVQAKQTETHSKVIPNANGQCPTKLYNDFQQDPYRGFV